MMQEVLWSMMSYGGFSEIAQLEVVQYIDGVILTGIYDVQWNIAFPNKLKPEQSEKEEDVIVDCFCIWGFDLGKEQMLVTKVIKMRQGKKKRKENMPGGYSL